MKWDLICFNGRSLLHKLLEKIAIWSSKAMAGERNTYQRNKDNEKLLPTAKTFP